MVSPYDPVPEPAGADRRRIKAVAGLSAVAFAGRLIVTVERALLLADLASVTIADPGGGQKRFAAAEVDLFEVPRREGVPLVAFTLSLQGLIPLDLYQSTVRVSLALADGSVRAQWVGLRDLGLSGGIDADFIALVQAAILAGQVDPRLGLVFDRNCRWIDVTAIPDGAIDRAITSPFGLLLEGWIENLGGRDIAILTRDFSGLSVPEDRLTYARPDIDSHLVASAFGRPARAHHAFTLCFPGCRPEPDGLFLLERAGEAVTMTGPLPVRHYGGRATACRIGLSGLLAAPGVSHAKIERFLLPFVARPALPATVDLSRAGPDEERPRLSIIVPLRGPAIFLQTHLLNQDRSPPGVEWIFALSSAGDNAGLERLIRSHAGTVSRPTCFLRLANPRSLAHLLNEAARAATGDVLLFLDESTWIDSFAPVARAMEALTEPGCSAVGVEIRLDDGTLDHHGVIATPNEAFPSITALRAMGRGSALGADRAAVEPLAAGATLAWQGLAIDRHRFGALEFDEGFSGDSCFDADLGYQLRRQGHPPFQLICGDGLRRAFPVPAKAVRTADIDEAEELLDAIRLTLRVPAAAADPDGRARES